MTFIDNHEAVKQVGDIAAITVTVGTILSFLPALAAIFTIIWTGIRIYETATAQRMFLSGGANFVAAANASITLMHGGGLWIEIGRKA